MNVSSAQLLKLLSSGISGVGAGLVGGASPIGAAATPFADLLKQAQDGSISSSLPVSVTGDAETAGVQLSDAQLTRLAAAADKLETAGVHTALVNIDGQKLVLDVHARQVTGRATCENGITSGVDGIMDLGDQRVQDALAGAQNVLGSAGTALAGVATNLRLGPPSGGLVQSPSVAKLLAQLAATKPSGLG